MRKIEIFLGGRSEIRSIHLLTKNEQASATVRAYQEDSGGAGLEMPTDPGLGAGESLLHGHLEAGGSGLLLATLLLVPVTLHGALQLRLLAQQVLTAAEQRHTVRQAVR